MLRTASISSACLVLAIAAGGCASAPPSGAVGHVDIPLTASGANGAIYRLPAGTILELFSATFFNDFALDGDDPAATVDLPPGTYGAELFNAAGFTTVWPLTRQNPDGSTETVQASLDALPSFTVTEGQTTPLEIRFHVGLAGDISFAHGSALAFVDVDETAATSFQFAFDLPSLTTTIASATADAPPQLAARLPAVGSADQSYSAVARTTGPFILSSTAQVCAPATVTITAASGPGQFTDLLNEATDPANASLCIDQISPVATTVVLTATRVGLPATPLLSDLTDQTVGVFYNVQASFGAQVIEGTTLHLGALTGARAATTVLFGEILELTGDTFTEWFELQDNGTGTETMTPM